MGVDIAIASYTCIATILFKNEVFVMSDNLILHKYSILSLPTLALSLHSYFVQ